MSTQTLDAARTRLLIAKASRIEFDLAKAKRELLTVGETFDLLRRLQTVALDKVSWQERSMLEKHMNDALESFSETIKRIQGDAKR